MPSEKLTSFSQLCQRCAPCYQTEFLPAGWNAESTMEFSNKTRLWVVRHDGLKAECVWVCVTHGVPSVSYGCYCDYNYKRNLTILELCTSYFWYFYFVLTLLLIKWPFLVKITGIVLYVSVSSHSCFTFVLSSQPVPVCAGIHTAHMTITKSVRLWVSECPRVCAYTCMHWWGYTGHQGSRWVNRKLSYMMTMKQCQLQIWQWLPPSPQAGPHIHADPGEEREGWQSATCFQLHLTLYISESYSTICHSVCVYIC